MLRLRFLTGLICEIYDECMFDDDMFLISSTKTKHPRLKQTSNKSSIRWFQRSKNTIIMKILVEIDFFVYKKMVYHSKKISHVNCLLNISVSSNFPALRLFIESKYMSCKMNQISNEIRLPCNGCIRIHYDYQNNIIISMC